jgi:gamma-glutamyltranspeptidase/glutathione hydrolase
MNRISCIVALIATSITYAPVNAFQSNQVLTGQSAENMVASVHPLATEAGLGAFEKDGNAIDAAVSTALMLGVVDGFNSGIGGGCFILIRTADGQLIAIDGREMAPAAAQRDMYLREQKVDTRLSQTGPLAIGIPGALAAYHQAVTEFGKLPFNELVTPAADVAEQGFPVTEAYQKKIKSASRDLARFPGSAAVLLKGDGSIYEAGEILIQEDLANTYRQIAKNGPSWFYNGPFAKQLESWMQQNGGIVTARDMANYQTVRRQPVRTRYREYEIVGFPPPSSGGVHVAQILNILESFDLKQMHAENPATMRHVVAEAMKLAFADRAYWLGDPDYVQVPLGLIDKYYARQLAKQIQLQRTTLVVSHGVPPASDSKFFEKHTTHVAAADSQGNWIAITTTVNTTFGSKVIVPGLGVVMNNQMDDFSIAPGVPNAFGLIGGENNAVAAGKRPLSSMSPTIVLKDGQPVMTLGAAGGPKIITEVLWAIINHLDLGMPIGEAVGAPRVHHQWSPDRLLVEDTMDAATVKQLESFGHKIQLSEVVGIAQAISYDAKTGLFTGVSDPRTTGKAAGLTPSLTK